MQLAAEDTVIKVSEKIKDIWHTLNRVEKAKASFTLAAFGDYTVHYLWIEELEAKGTTITAFVEMVATMTDDELITYLYNELSIYKRVDGIIGRYKILEDQ